MRNDNAALRSRRVGLGARAGRSASWPSLCSGRLFRMPRNWIKRCGFATPRRGFVQDHCQYAGHDGHSACRLASDAASEHAKLYHRAAGSRGRHRLYFEPQGDSRAITTTPQSSSMSNASSASREIAHKRELGFTVLFSNAPKARQLHKARDCAVMLTKRLTAINAGCRAMSHRYVLPNYRRK